MKERIIMGVLSIILILLIIVYFLIPTPYKKIDNKSNDKEIENNIVKNNIVIYLDNNLSIKKEEVYKENELLNIEEIINMIDKKIIIDKYSDLYNSKDLEKQMEDKANKMLKDFGNDWSEAVTYFTGFSTKEEYINNLKFLALEEELAKDYYVTTLDDKTIKDFYDNYSGEIYYSYLYSKKVISPDTNEADLSVMENIKKVLNEIKNSNNIIEKLKEYKSIYVYNDTIINTSNIDNKELLKVLIDMKDNSLYNEVAETENGYYILYRKSRKKNEFNKNNIIKEMTNIFCIGNEGEYIIDSYNYLRKQYNMKINDKKLEKEYNNYINEKNES